MGARKPGPQGERAISRKTIAWGMPDVFRCLRCEYSCAYLTTPSAHEAAGALGTRHSPRPRSSRAKHFWHSSSAARGENVDGCRRHSKARVQRAKSRDSGLQQRIARNDGLRRIASHALAMTRDQQTRLFDNRIGNLQASPGFAKASPGNLRCFATIVRGWPANRSCEAA
jgi:hypothetical protein